MPIAHSYSLAVFERNEKPKWYHHNSAVILTQQILALLILRGKSIFIILFNLESSHLVPTKLLLFFKITFQDPTFHRLYFICVQSKLFKILNYWVNCLKFYQILFIVNLKATFVHFPIHNLKKNRRNPRINGQNQKILQILPEFNFYDLSFVFDCSMRI